MTDSNMVRNDVLYVTITGPTRAGRSTLKEHLMLLLIRDHGSNVEVKDTEEHQFSVKWKMERGDS